MESNHLGKSKLSRREFIYLTGAGLGAVYLGGCASLFRSDPSAKAPDFSKISPFDRSRGEIGAREFSGDEPVRAHSVFWNPEAFLQRHGGKVPPPSESVDITVVGGGVAGLSSAYLLKDFKPLVLEQATRMGGNSRGESWNGIDYPIGAVYLSLVKEGSPVSDLFDKIGLKNKLVSHLEDDPIIINGIIHKNCWDNGTTNENKAQFNRLKQYFTAVNQETQGHWFPQIPTESKEHRKKLNHLDSESFHSHLQRIAGEPLHPDLENLIEHYCWSTYAGSSKEVSAASGLNFFAGDFEGTNGFPGGNATVSEALLNALYKDLGPEKLRTSSIVFDVRVVEDGVHITYLDSNDQLRTVHSRYVMMSCPKFVAAKMIHDLEPERLKAISSLRYRSYLVGTLIIRKKIPSWFYDLEFFSQANQAHSNVNQEAQSQGVTDIIQRGDQNHTVLSLYRGIPYDGARSELYAETAYSKYRGEFEKQINETILPMLNLEKKDVVDLRLARWGHPIPLAAVGNIASGRVDWFRKPFKDRVFFAEQDNWTLPCFETSFHEASTWSSVLRKKLTGI